MTRTGGADRRRKIVDEAIAAFGQRGFEATSLDAVAEAAGLRKQSLLYYFPSKEELFDACVTSFSEHLGGVLEEVLDARVDSGWERVERVIRAIFDMGRQKPELALFAREAARRSPEVVQRVASMLEPLRKRAIAFLEREMEHGVFRAQDPGLLLFTLYTAIVGSLTEAGVLRAVAGGAKGKVALKMREEELLEFVKRALSP